MVYKIKKKLFQNIYSILWKAIQMLVLKQIWLKISIVWFFLILTKD